MMTMMIRSGIIRTYTKYMKTFNFENRKRKCKLSVAPVSSDMKYVLLLTNSTKSSLYATH